MAYIPLILAVIQLIIRVWDAIKERNDEVKKKKTEIIQSAARGIVDRDASRITSAFDELNRLR